MTNNASSKNSREMLEGAYAFLTDVGACRTQTEFSREWLGSSDHYFAYLRSAHAEPNLTAMSHLGRQMVNVSSAIRRESGFARGIEVHARKMFELGLEMSLSALFEGWNRQRRSRSPTIGAS